MNDLAEWLLERIGEDEADVAAILRQDPNWEADGDGVFDRPDRRIAYVRGDYAAAHIARWDPARVLAECEAKRRIVERCAAPTALYQDRKVLEALALPYADRPGYDEAWRP